VLSRTGDDGLRRIATPNHSGNAYAMGRHTSADGIQVIMGLLLEGRGFARHMRVNDAHQYQVLDQCAIPWLQLVQGCFAQFRSIQRNNNASECWCCARPQWWSNGPYHEHWTGRGP